MGEGAKRVVVVMPGAVAERRRYCENNSRLRPPPESKIPFSGVRSINEVLGTYVSAEAHAGVVKSSKAQVMTKGEVSLALAGTGEGVDLGVAFGGFTIEAR